jgi:CRP/FNR family transcriptional regulator, cyclic AMP receptor protein
MDTAYDLLASQPFLTGLSDDQLDRLARWSKRAVFHGGKRIFREGTPADRFWLIQRGRVNLDTHAPGRGDVIIETIGPSAVLGWSWLFPPYQWHFGAVALETTLTIELDGPGVRQLCALDPALGYELSTRFMQVMLERLQATRLRLLDLYRVPT